MKISITGYVYRQQYPWEDLPTYYLMRGPDASSTHFHRAGPDEVTVAVEVPDDYDPRPHQIEALKERRERVQAEAGKKVAEIEQEIAKLTAIEYREAA